MTASAPVESVSSSTVFITSIDDDTNASTPFSLANATFLSSKSNPITLHPFANNNSAVIKPINPNPTTTTVSPNVGFTSLIPCKPIAPITVNAASS